MRKAASNKYFEFFTTSSKNQRSSDCVVRSISIAENDTWETVYNKLCDLGRSMYRMPNEKQVIEKYLTENGWIKQKMPKHSNGKRFTGKQFCDEFGSEYTTAIISMRGHLAVMKDSKFWDIWDCTDCCVGNFWIKNN